jgi:cytochrome P450
VTEKRSPTIDEITKTSVPYLDATIEEILRTARVFPGAIRNATVDTTILGHRIPKGTDVFFLNNGPDYLTPGFNIQDSLRTQSALEAKNQTGSWDPEDMAVFKPERWLVTTEEGNTAFDSMAGPNLSFGLGPRGCFGRRLAYLELRIILVMLIWNFEFLKCPDDLSSYAAIDKLSRQPKSCFVRVKSVSF